MPRHDHIGSQPELEWDRSPDRYYCSDCASYDCIMRGVDEPRSLNDVLAVLGLSTRGGLYGIKQVVDAKGVHITTGSASQVWHYLVRAGIIKRGGEREAANR